jgi:hypothetical protein
MGGRWLGLAVVPALLLAAPAPAHLIEGAGNLTRAQRIALATAEHQAAREQPRGGIIDMPQLSSAGSFQLVGHDPLLNRGMNAAIAAKGNYVYVGSRTDGTHLDAGVLVVDVERPSKPRVVHQIGPPEEGNPMETSRELRIWPEKNLLIVLNHGCSELIHRCAPSSAYRANYKFFDIGGRNAARPKLVSTYYPLRSSQGLPHEFFLWDDPARPGRALIYQTTPSTSDGTRENLIVTDISKARQGTFAEVAKWTATYPPGDPPESNDNRLHSLSTSHDGRRAYLAYLGGGFLVLDTSDIAAAKREPELRLVTPVENRADWGDPGAHSAIKLFGRPFALTTDEVYGKLGGVLAEHGCPWGWSRLLDVADETRPRVVSEYRIAPHNFESYCDQVPPDQENFSSQASHNPTLTPNLALVTWHSRGFQAFSLEDPANPQATASFVPEPLPAVQTEDPALSQGRDKVVMWSYPIVKDGLIYVLDLRNGLYILRYRGRCADEVSGASFLEGNSNLGDWGRFERQGPGAGCSGGQAASGAATAPDRTTRDRSAAVPGGRLGSLGRD